MLAQTRPGQGRTGQGVRRVLDEDRRPSPGDRRPMEALVHAMLSNALVATGLALAPLGPEPVRPVSGPGPQPLAGRPAQAGDAAAGAGAPGDFLCLRPRYIRQGPWTLLPGSPWQRGRIGKNCPPTWSKTTASPPSGLELISAMIPRSRLAARNRVRRAVGCSFAAAACETERPHEQDFHAENSPSSITLRNFRAGTFLPWR